MKQRHFLVWMVCFVHIGSIVSSEVEAGPPSDGLRQQRKVNRQPRRDRGERALKPPNFPPEWMEPEPEPEGMYFYEPNVFEAMELLRAGQPDAAIKTLKKAEADAAKRSLDQINEIRLGLGMVLLRAGRMKESHKYVLGLTQMKREDTTSVVPRAKLMLGIISRGENRSLLSDESWRAALLTVAEQSMAKLESCHSTISIALDKGGLKKIKQPLEEAAALVEIPRVLRVENMNNLELRTARHHIEMLANELDKVNATLERAINLNHKELTRAGFVRDERNQYRRKHNRKYALQAGVVRTQNQLCKTSADVFRVGKALELEYARIHNRYGALLGFNRDARVLISEAELPQPIRNP